MKALSLKQIKDELKHREPLELIEIVLSLSKFKKENKELLTYLLFEADNEDGYIESVKSEITEQFTLINTKNYYFMKKGARKILTNTKKFIRYSKKKETEIADMIKKAIAKLHEDLQYEYNLELKELII